MHLLAECFVFWGDDWSFLKEGVKTYPMAPILPFNSPILSGLHIYSLWSKQIIV